MFRTPLLDQIQQVNELNRAFLALLQSRARQQRACLGLPPAAQAALAGSSPSILDNLACFPRALFDLDLGARGNPQGAERGIDFDDAERELCLVALSEARTTSRYSAHGARVLFGLEVADIERLCAAPLTDLQRLACAPGALLCAFRERSWIWQGLLTATRPEVRRQFTLMALQPCIALGWPQRRPPQASA